MNLLDGDISGKNTVDLGAFKITADTTRTSGKVVVGIRPEDIAILDHPEPEAVDTRRYPRVDLKLPILYRLVGEDLSEAPESARPFLIAYNVNLNTTSTRRANAVAYDIREKGRIKRDGDPVTGKIIR